jgi:anoctamin-10
MNSVTEKMEPFYPEGKRRMRYLESFLVSSVFLAVIMFYLLCMYNITGVIKQCNHFDFLYIPLLGDLAKEGELFDANSNMNFIPSLFQTIFTMVLNFKFRDIAKTLTDKENHKYQSTYDNSLIIKRFFFEFFDCFLPLIYLGWWELDFKMLRQTVIMLYVVDEIRRVALESLLPYLTQNQDKIRNNVKQLALSIKKQEAQKNLESGSQKTEEQNL